MSRQWHLVKFDMLGGFQRAPCFGYASPEIVNAQIATISSRVSRLSLKAKRLQAFLERVYASESWPF